MQRVAWDGLLSLAAAPTFATTALLTGVLGGDASNMLCMSAHEALLGGMIPMYVLMSAFHLTPWLKLISLWRSGDPKWFYVKGA